MARVLLIDDEQPVRSALRRLLTHMGHEVVEAENGRMALTLAAREAVDLVITDINMPEADGIEVIMALSERQPELPVIAVSGGGLMEKQLLLQNAEILGARFTLTKPFDLDVFQETVERALGGGGSAS